MRRYNSFVEFFKVFFLQSIAHFITKDQICIINIPINSINEKIMLESVGDLRGVPQGPAYARVLAEIVLEEMISQFFMSNSMYQEDNYMKNNLSVDTLSFY